MELHTLLSPQAACLRLKSLMSPAINLILVTWETVFYLFIYGMKETFATICDPGSIVIPYSCLAFLRQDLDM